MHVGCREWHSGGVCRDQCFNETPRGRVQVNLNSGACGGRGAEASHNCRARLQHCGSVAAPWIGGETNYSFAIEGITAGVISRSRLPCVSDDASQQKEVARCQSPSAGVSRLNAAISEVIGDVTRPISPITLDQILADRPVEEGRERV